MESKTTRRFRDALAALPRNVQRRANEAYKLFQENPRHPSLQFKKVHSTLPAYSVRITDDYRTVGLLDEGVIVWFWIGSHADYDRLLASL